MCACSVHWCWHGPPAFSDYKPDEESPLLEGKAHKPIANAEHGSSVEAERSKKKEVKKPPVLLDL